MNHISEDIQKSTMTLSEELVWRGMINQTTLIDITYLDKNNLIFYHGFDASAPSQTVGNLAAMMVDLVFLRHGHKAIILAGGSTSLIGDPGGKDKERPLQSVETITNNVSRAQKQIQKIYHGYEFTLVNNIDWTGGLSVLDFLRDVGKYFNVGEMIKKDYIATRLGEGGSGISYTEFSYSLLQGLDFLHLYKKYNCTLQVGGSDQWSNCLAGVELIRRKLGEEVHVITLPLVINRATGKKFGKTEAGAIWLDPDLTSPYDFYQFWLNVDDESVKEYLKIYTQISKNDYNVLIEDFEKNKSGRSAQKYLAFSITELVHGRDEAEKARDTSNALFGQKADSTNINLPSVQILEKYIFDQNINIVDFLSDMKLVKSKREARDLIDSSGIYINDEVIDSYLIPKQKCTENSLLRIGKKRYYKIILN